ncbi:MAG TPA: ABC transporter permease [Puia sp.]|nr:ABC transporter permease [Puia sp.]
MQNNIPERKWQEVITPHNSLFTLNIKEIWSYRDLLLILMRRDIVAIYKQTILGPLWFVLQPLLTTITFVIVFARAARLSTMGLPPILFYLSGLVLWTYFSECIIRTSTFLKDSSPILSKVYFPRLIVPLSLILTNLVKFSIQLGLFFVIYLYYLFVQKTPVAPNGYALLLPVLILLVALLGLGSGMIISSLTTRYKDLAHLTTFGVQLLMFTSPVIFPLSSFGKGVYGLVIRANPMTGIIEAFRYAFLGKGELNWPLLGYDTLFIGVLLLVGILVFNSIEKSFVDSI